MYLVIFILAIFVIFRYILLRGCYSKISKIYKENAMNPQQKIHSENIVKLIPKNNNSWLYNEIKKINYRNKIKIRSRKLKDKTYSLYLDIWNNGKREYKSLNLFVLNKNNSKQKDKENLLLAKTFRDKLQSDLQEKQFGFKLNKKNYDFIDYAELKVNNNTRPDTNIKCMINYMKKFLNGQYQSLNQIDEKFCQDFANYLNTLDIAQNTRQLYFRKFSRILNIAVLEKILDKNPCQFVNKPKIEETKKEFLLESEIKKLMETQCKNNEIKQAFLFSCFTGLRLSDVKKITFDNIENGYYKIQQQKTKSILRNKLQKNAIKIIEEQKTNGNTENIFSFPPSSQTRHKVLKDWIKKAGIKKEITFHCGRHTFATWCLTNGVDILTVKELLGHKNIRHTMVYANVLNKTKDAAIDTLPTL